MNKKEYDNLKKILKGEEPEKKIQTGYNDGKIDNKTPTKTGRSPGEEWTEHGKKWKMDENGNVTNITRMDEYRMPWFCPECKNIMKGSKDRQAWNIHGCCLNCLVDYHEELRKAGKLEQFAFRKRLLSAQSWLDQQKEEFDGYVESIKESPEYVYSDGRTETWTNEMDTDEMIQEYKDFLTQYEKDLNNSLEKYKSKYGEELNEWVGLT